MGERKGVNKYYPPDWTPAMGSLNKYHGTHALRERARKISQGILIIRFEMPYNIWCEGCKNHIGMGVRYNAEKKKVGMYYTTPIYQFRMKCHLCNNHFEIKTDPQNLDYIIVSGAHRQERRWDPTHNGQVVPEEKQTSQKLATDAMFKLEHVVNDQKKGNSVALTLAQLEDRQSRWRDNYMANKLLRNQFREKKQELARQYDVDRKLLIKSSLDIPLLPENQQDVKLARLLHLTPLETMEDVRRRKRDKINRDSIFDDSVPETLRRSLTNETQSLSEAFKQKARCIPGVVVAKCKSAAENGKAETSTHTQDCGSASPQTRGLVNYSDGGTSESDENS